MAAPKGYLLAPVDHERMAKELEAIATRAIVLQQILNRAYGPSIGDRALAVESAARRCKAMVDQRFYSQPRSMTGMIEHLKPEVWETGDLPNVPQKTLPVRGDFPSG